MCKNCTLDEKIKNNCGKMGFVYCYSDLHKHLFTNEEVK